jgi:hypothetical protein
MSTVLLFFGMIAFVGGIVAIIEAQTPPARYLAVLLTLAGVILLLLFASSGVFARDDGRYAGSPLKPWFDSLKSGKGPCCSDADGTALSDVDWDTVDGHYRVRIGGQWIDVPDDAVIKEPNRAGRTMVWPIYANGMPTIRCFMPGSMI